MILLDTCVISEVARRTPDRRVPAWFEAVPDEELFLSAISVGELQKGIGLLDPGPRQEAVAAWLDGLVFSFLDCILPFDEPVARRWGDVSALAQRLGRPRPPVDSMIAATALHHGLRVATRNVAEFEGTGVALINPWG